MPNDDGNALHESDAVSQPGQCVVVREMKHLCVGQALFSDVGVGLDETAVLQRMGADLDNCAVVERRFESAVVMEFPIRFAAVGQRWLGWGNLAAHQGACPRSDKIQGSLRAVIGVPQQVDNAGIDDRHAALPVDHQDALADGVERNHQGAPGDEAAPLLP